MKHLVKQGTAKVWKNAGGDYALSVASLAVGAGRCGIKADLNDMGSDGCFPGRIAVTAEFNLDVAPTAGGVIEVYWSPSRDNTKFAGGATGTDAAYKAAEEDEWKQQLLHIGSLVVTADADGVVQTQTFDPPFEPPTRYGCPVIINKTDQAFEGDEDAHRLTFDALPDVSL